MGKEFGNLQKVSGIVYYVLSPHEVNPLKDFLSKGIKNTIRRTRESFFWVTIPAGIVYVIVDMVKAEHTKSLRKNPADYVNDV